MIWMTRALAGSAVEAIARAASIAVETASTARRTDMSLQRVLPPRRHAVYGISHDACQGRSKVHPVAPVEMHPLVVEDGRSGSAAPVEKPCLACGERCGGEPVGRA